MRPTLSLPLGRASCVLVLSFIIAATVLSSAGAQEPLGVRRNFFGSHNLMDGGPHYEIGIDWTAEMNGPGYVFDWVRGDYEVWVDYCFQRGLIPCLRLQNGNGGELPSAWYMGSVAAVICNYKLAHPQYADRYVYFQLWNEPGDHRDWVEPEDFADFMVDGYNYVKTAEANAAAQNPDIAGTLIVMTPGQNGPSWWERAWSHNPAAKNAFDVWATHPYPESNPPWYNHHDGVCSPDAVKTIDSYVLDLDKLAENHGGISRRGFPVMITETAYGDHLGISYEGYPKTTRQMAADYNVDAFGERWYKWPEILAVHPFILCNITWDAFGFVHWYSGSQDTDGDGVREPTSPYPQYTAVRDLRESLESQGKLAPARISPYRGAKGSISGTVTRSDNSSPVKHATIYTDGYEFGNVSLYDGGYAICDVPVGSYTLSCHKKGYVDASTQITVSEGQNTTADFNMLYVGKDPHQFYFVDTAHGGCDGCSLYASFLGQTFRTPPDVGFMTFCAAKPNVGDLYLRFTIIDGDNPYGQVVGSFTSYYLEGGFGGEMIGGEAPGDGIEVLPDHTYFLKIERTDGQGVYLYASSSNPYPDGHAWVGDTPQPGWDLYGCYRGNRVAVFTDVGTIAGHVENSTGQDLQGATVIADPGGYSDTTDADGDYSIENVLVGTYSATATKAGYQPQTQTGKSVVKDQTTTVDFTLTPAPTGTIAGHVENAAGQDLPGAQVVTSPGGYSGTTDPNGDYTIEDVNTGTYDVTASNAGYAPGTQTGVVVNQSQTTVVDFVLQNAAPFAGIANGDFEGGSYNDPDGDHSVANSWTKFIVSGDPKYSVTWLTTWHSGNYGQVFYESGWVAGIYQQAPNATIGYNYTASVWAKGSNGTPTFRVGIDPTGGIDATSPNVQWSDQYTPDTTWTQISKQVAAQSNIITMFIKAENPVGINYAYMDDAAVTESVPPAGTISGYVKDTGDNPLVGASVSTDPGGYATTSGAGGGYTLTGVAPGTYDVTATKSGYLPQTDPGKTVTGGGTTTADFNLTDASAPTTPIVVDDGTYTTDTTQLHAEWSASDPESGVTEYRYAVGIIQGGTDVVDWTSAGTNTSVTKTGLALDYDDQYFFAVQAKNRDQLWSVMGYSDGITAARSVNTISAAKGYPDGSAVSLSGKVITAATATGFWIEESDRTSAIKVSAPGSLAQGQGVTVSGVLSCVDAERMLDAPEYETSAPLTVPGALGISNASVGGGAFNAYTPGVTDGQGVNNIGLLVRVWGVVTSSDSDHFFIDDGTLRADFAGQIGLKIASGSLAEPSVGTFALVTGIVTTESVGGNTVPVILPRTQDDILPLSP